jgi:hypothetical protein
MCLDKKIIEAFQKRGFLSNITGLKLIIQALCLGNEGGQDLSF